MDFTNLYEIEQRNLLQLLEVEQGGVKGTDGGGDLTMYNISLFVIVNMTPLSKMNTS
jgi:hypothetical protein